MVVTKVVELDYMWVQLSIWTHTYCNIDNSYFIVLSLIIVPHCYLIRYNSTEQQVRTQYKTHYTTTVGFRQSSGNHGEAKSSQANHQPNHTDVLYPATLLRNQQGLSNKKALAKMTGQVPKTKKTNINMVALCHKTPTTSPKRNDKTKAQTRAKSQTQHNVNLRCITDGGQHIDGDSSHSKQLQTGSKAKCFNSYKIFNPWKMVMQASTRTTNTNTTTTGKPLCYPWCQLKWWNNGNQKSLWTIYHQQLTQALQQLITIDLTTQILKFYANNRKPPPWPVPSYQLTPQPLDTIAQGNWPQTIWTLRW